MKIAIVGGPKTGKTTLSKTLGLPIKHTDDLISTHEWSKDSEEGAKWFDSKEDQVIEGVTVVRALRKWMDNNTGKPVDIVYFLEKPYLNQNPGQKAMSKGVETIWNEIKLPLRKRGVEVRSR